MYVYLQLWKFDPSLITIMEQRSIIIIIRPPKGLNQPMMHLALQNFEPRDLNDQCHGVTHAPAMT
jgi:hypothetical protein